MDWKKIKRPPILRPQKVRCPHCHSFVPQGNFCSVCAKRIRNICNCWIVNNQWRCWRKEGCPGLGFYNEALQQNETTKMQVLGLLSKLH